MGIENVSRTFESSLSLAARHCSQFCDLGRRHGVDHFDSRSGVDVDSGVAIYAVVWGDLELVEFFVLRGDGLHAMCLFFSEKEWTDGSV